MEVFEDRADMFAGGSTGEETGGTLSEVLGGGGRCSGDERSRSLVMCLMWCSEERV